MKKFLPILLCLSLSPFVVARAINARHASRDSQNRSETHRKQSFDVSESEENDVAAEQDTDEEVAPNYDDGIEDVSTDEGEQTGDDGGDDGEADGGADEDD